MKRKTPLILGLLLVLVLGYTLASRYLPVKSNLRDQPVKVAVATNNHPRVHLDTVLKIRAERFLTGRKRA